MKAKIINTKAQGIPQSRPRFYLVGIHKKALVGKFRFPAAIEPEGVDKFLDGPNVAERVQRSDGKTSAAAYNAALAKFAEKNVDSTKETCLLDVGATPRFSSAIVGCCPCLTASRAKASGHFVTTRSGMMTLSEICRFQGLPQNRYTCARDKVNMSHAKFGFAVGNAMSVNVLERLFPKVLRAANLVHAKKIQCPTTFSRLLV